MPIYKTLRTSEQVLPKNIEGFDPRTLLFIKEIILGEKGSQTTCKKQKGR